MSNMTNAVNAAEAVNVINATKVTNAANVSNIHKAACESKPKVVLAYSGGLDTSVAVKWLQEHYGFDVIACCIDLGETKDHKLLEERAARAGAAKTIIIDAKAEFAHEYILPALKANALYEGKYPLSTSLGRPLIAKKLVEIAKQEGAAAIAHGCTGKGNDQVRLEVGISSLAPELAIIGVIRDWGMSREEEIQYAEAHGIPIPVKKDNPFSIDANIWGRACEGGVLEDAGVEPPEAAFSLTKAPAESPDEPEYVDIEFIQGCPVQLNGQAMDLVALIETLNEIGGRHGVGRIDHIESRLVGIKSREIYENPAAVILINAHKELEHFTLPRDVTEFKAIIDQRFTQMIYDGLWFSPLTAALQAFIQQTQHHVTGKIRVKLYKGSQTVVGRWSDYSLYQRGLATYSMENTFDHNAAVGFIKLWGLPSQVYAAAHKHPVDRSWRDHTWPNHLQQNSGEDVLLNLPKSS
ncbi:MAG: argininosuccinate synthase [Limnochordia bacterium]